jgi:deoxycytidylate deaminase
MTEESLGVDQEGSTARTEAPASDLLSGVPMDYLLSRLLRVANYSHCDKVKFGAAALDGDGNVFAYGWNHNPCTPAAPNACADPVRDFSCSRDCVGGIRRDVRSGTCVERCFAVHAEQHAILSAKSVAALTGPKPIYEIAVAGRMPDGSLFDNSGGFYCTVCARIMLTAGVQRVSIWDKGVRRRLTIRDVWDQSYGMLNVPLGARG